VVKWRKLIKVPVAVVTWIVGWVIAYFGRRKRERKHE